MYKILFNSDNKGITFMSMDKNDNNVNVEKIMNGLSDGTLKIYKSENTEKVKTLECKLYEYYHSVDYIVA
jgi:hypothetical protein